MHKGDRRIRTNVSCVQGQSLHLLAGDFISCGGPGNHSYGNARVVDISLGVHLTNGCSEQKRPERRASRGSDQPFGSNDERLPSDGGTASGNGAPSVAVTEEPSS